MKTIVCGVDDSPGSSAALRVAAELGQTLGARLVLAHVARLPRRGRQAREEAMHLLDRVVREHSLAGVVDRRAEVGDRAAGLARVAVEEAAVLILIGAPNQGWAYQRHPGRLAAELRGSVSCPVLVVPPGEHR